MSGRGHLRDVRHQVVGDAERVLADVSGLVRARGVEVAEEGDGPGGVRRGHVHHHLLHGVLGRAVRVGALPDPGSTPQRGSAVSRVVTDASRPAGGTRAPRTPWRRS